MKDLPFITIMICLFTLGAMAQKKGYTISGKIKNLPDNVTFYLIQHTTSGRPDTIYQVKSKDQKFKFKGELKEEGRLTFVKVDTSIIKLVKGNKNVIRLLLDNSDIELTGTIDEWPNINIKGSIATEEFERFNKITETAKSEVLAKLNKLQGENKIVRQAEIEREFNRKYIEDLKSIDNTYAAPLFILNNGAFEPNDLEIAYKKLSNKLKNSFYGKKLKQHIFTMKMSEKIAIGKPIPDFQIKYPEGKIESVKNLVMKSKYTLIDFWAYWCKPCRADVPHMKKVYNAFHDKGFNIISVSTDPNELPWKKALKEENTPWINGIQQGNVSKDLFGISAIPGYILLNDKAEIVQMDMISFLTSKKVTMNGMQAFLRDSKKKGLRGNELYQVIDELLGKSK